MRGKMTMAQGVRIGTGFAAMIIIATVAREDCFDDWFRAPGTKLPDREIVKMDTIVKVFLHD
jgi:hypothetical protein